MSDERLIVPLAPSRMWGPGGEAFLPLLAGFIGAMVTIGGLASIGTVQGPFVMAAGVLVVGVVVATLVRMRAEHLVFTPEVVTLVTWQRSRSIPMAQVCAVAWVRGPLGDEVHLVVVRPRTGAPLAAAVQLWDWMTIRRWVQRVEPEIVVDPPKIWQDRFGDIHGLPPDSDPAASLRAVREAYVDVWHVKIEVSEVDGRLRFRTIANTVWGPPGLWAGDERDTLAEATADGVAIIEDLRHTT